MDAGNVSALFWALVGLSGGAGVTAYSISGAKARYLWIVCGLLLAGALLLRFGVPSWTAGFATSMVLVLWALYPMLTIAAVAIIIEHRRVPLEQKSDAVGAPVEPKSDAVAAPVELKSDAVAAPVEPTQTKAELPKFAADALESEWTPDISYNKALDYYIRAAPLGYYDHSFDEGKNAFHEALANEKVTAWGRAHPTETDLVKIRPDFWRGTEPTIKTNYVFSSRLNVGAYDIHLSRAEMEVVWPPKAEA